MPAQNARPTGGTGGHDFASKNARKRFHQSALAAIDEYLGAQNGGSV